VRSFWIAVGCAVAVLIALNLILFTVDETKQAVITQMGRPVRSIADPGLHVKLPYPVQTAHYFDDRLLVYDSAPTEILTEDKKNLVVDNYARWRIVDPLLFMQTVRDENGAQARLDDIIYSELRVELGKHDLQEVVSTAREQLMKIVTDRCDERARDYGISIMDVRIKRADLPEENERFVYERMRAERRRKANMYRSEGEEEALKIRAQTDKEKTILLAEAYRSAQETRGEGDAAATKIYAAALQADPEFYRFWRTLEAYRAALDTSTVLVLSPDSDFFRYLQRR
jgi:membrane protease subunit HflC